MNDTKVGFFPQFRTEINVVENIQVLEIQQPERLKIRIPRKKIAQFVQSIPIQRLGMLNPLLKVNRSHLYYQFATVALNIWSVISFDISAISPSCTAVSNWLES